MNVESLMSTGTLTCHSTESLADAARLMWESDCGAVVVVDPAGHAIGMITDRDICMCALLQGRPLRDIPVTTAASRRLVALQPRDTLDTAEAAMQRERVRRLPVLDANGKPIGILTANDLVRAGVAPGVQPSALTAPSILRTVASLASRQGDSRRGANANGGDGPQDGRSNHGSRARAP